MKQDFHIRAAHWQTDAAALRAVREQVFVQEQGIAPEDEWDAHDALSRHALALDVEGNPIGTGRLLPDGHIGRMAVVAPWRHRGVASALLRQLLAWALAEGHREIQLHAQSYVVGFYERHGFRVEGEPFLEVGIPHRYMRRGS